MFCFNYQGSDSELITQALSMEPPEQFKQEYLMLRYKMPNRMSSPQISMTNGHSEHHHNPISVDPNSDTESIDSKSMYPSKFATQFSHDSDKEANFVARILHVSFEYCDLLNINISD